MSIGARLVRLVITVLAVGAWSASAVGAVYADAAQVRSASVLGAHAEAPGNGPAHASHPAHDCALCQVIQMAGDVPALAVVQSPVPAPVVVPVGRRLPLRDAQRVVHDSRGPPAPRV